MGEPYLRIYDDEFLPSEWESPPPIPRRSSRRVQGCSLGDQNNRTLPVRHNFSYAHHSRPIEPIQERPLGSPTYQRSPTQTDSISSIESRDTGDASVQSQRSSTSSSTSGSRPSYESARTSHTASSSSQGTSKGSSNESNNRSNLSLARFIPRRQRSSVNAVRQQPIKIERRVSFDQQSMHYDTRIPEEKAEQEEWKSSDHDTSGLTVEQIHKLKKKGINPALYAEMQEARKGKKWLSPLVGNTYIG